MSRRLSLAAKKGEKVRFTDDLIFQEDVKDNDVEALSAMLRRKSLTVDINQINDSGLTALHQACLDGNLTLVRLLIRYGADINIRDEDTWTPLHAAAAEGHADVVRYLLARGADKYILTDDGEQAVDLVDTDDSETLRVFMEHTAFHGQHSIDQDSEKAE